MPEFVTHYWVEWLFGVIAAALIALYHSLKKRVCEEIEEHNAVKNGMRAFLRRQIIADCENAIKTGYASTTLKDAVKDLYESYHGLGGNGVVTQLYNQFLLLSTVMPDEQ